ncbi:hypothetical protein [Candidatus Tisiphia endosymbiont of Parasteatoda lunata]
MKILLYQQNNIMFTNITKTKILIVNHSALQVQSLILRHECLMYVLT